MFATRAVVLALPLLAAASILPRTSGDGPSNQCNTGTLQCCQNTQSSSSLSSGLAGLLGLLGVVVGDLTGLVGSSCSAINVVGASGNSCTAQPVCCTGNSFNGIIATGCSPVNINL